MPVRDPIELVIATPDEDVVHGCARKHGTMAPISYGATLKRSGRPYLPQALDPSPRTEVSALYCASLESIQRPASAPAVSRFVDVFGLIIYFSVAKPFMIGVL